MNPEKPNIDKRRTSRGEGPVAEFLTLTDSDGNITYQGKYVMTPEQAEAILKESDLSFLQQEATELTEDEMTFEEWKEAMQNPDNVTIIDTGIRCTGEKYRPPGE